MPSQLDNEYSERLRSVAAAPVPFAGALRQALADAGEPSLLIYTPVHGTPRAPTPASVLAVTSRGWSLVEERAPGRLIVTAADFARTLSVELTEVLLYGRLDISYHDFSDTKHASIIFNTVTSDCYLDASHLVLRGMRGLAGAADSPPVRKTMPAEAELPLKFRAALHQLAPPGEDVLSLLSWPTTLRRHRFWIPRELAPAGMLVLTNVTLLVVREELERSILKRRRGVHYGKAAVFVSARRIRNGLVQRSPYPETIQIAFEISRHEGERESLTVLLPSSYRAPAERFLAELSGMTGPS